MTQASAISCPDARMGESHGFGSVQSVAEDSRLAQLERQVSVLQAERDAAHYDLSALRAYFGRSTSPADLIDRCDLQTGQSVNEPQDDGIECNENGCRKPEHFSALVKSRSRSCSDTGSHNGEFIMGTLISQSDARVRQLVGKTDQKLESLSTKLSAVIRHDSSRHQVPEKVEILEEQLRESKSACLSLEKELELAKIQVSSLEAVLKIQEQQLCRSVSTEMAATSKVTSLTKAEDLFVRRSLPFITQYNSTKSPSSTLTGLLTAWRNQVLRLLVQREVAALAAHQHQANERLLRESVESAQKSSEEAAETARLRMNAAIAAAEADRQKREFAESRVAQLTTQLSTMRDDMRCLKSACNSLYKETFMGLDTLMRQLGLAGLMQKPSMESSDRRNTNQNAIKPDLKQSQDRARVHLRMAHPTHAETECQSESETDNLPNPGSTPSVVSNLLSLSRLGHISYSQQTPFMSLVLHRLRELDRRLAFACQRLPMLSIQMARYRRNSAMAAISANGDFISRSSRACQTVESSSPNIMESLYGWHSETDNVVSGLGPLAFEELKSIARQAELEAAKAAREREIAIRQLEVDTKTFNERVDAVRASVRSEMTAMKERISTLESELADKNDIITTKQLQLNQQDESAAQERELLLADRTRLEDQLRKAQTNLALAALELRRITSSSAHSVVDSISSTAPARASVNHLDTDSVWLCQLDGVTCTSRHTKPNELPNETQRQVCESSPFFNLFPKETRERSRPNFKDNQPGSPNEVLQEPGIIHKAQFDADSTLSNLSRPQPSSGSLGSHQIESITKSLAELSKLARCLDSDENED